MKTTIMWMNAIVLTAATMAACAPAASSDDSGDDEGDAEGAVEGVEEGASEGSTEGAEFATLCEASLACSGDADPAATCATYDADCAADAECAYVTSACTAESAAADACTLNNATCANGFYRVEGTACDDLNADLSECAEDATRAYCLETPEFECCSDTDCGPAEICVDRVCEADGI